MEGEEIPKPGPSTESGGGAMGLLAANAANAAGDPETAAASGGEHAELYLQEIEAVDDYWGPTFRAIYESGTQEAFLALLEKRIADHDAEIEKMCNHHYRGFISSVRDLLHVRADATRLNEEVVEIDKAMRQSTEKITKKGKVL